MGLTLGIPPQTLKAMILELRFWIGVPNTVFAFRMVQEVINERKEWGEKADQEMAETVTHELVPGAAAIVDGYQYGEVWARSALSARERMVSILAALMGRGNLKQLRRQTGYALHVGLTKREICETFTQAGWYLGWPYVEDALIEAKQVFAERGLNEV